MRLRRGYSKSSERGLVYDFRCMIFATRFDDDVAGLEMAHTAMTTGKARIILRVLSTGLAL